jgi:hypothetical protein
MMRDELLKRIGALPADADVGIRIGDDQVDIADVVPWGEGAFGAIVCNPVDLRDVLFERRLSAGRLHRNVSDTTPKAAG